MSDMHSPKKQAPEWASQARQFDFRTLYHVLVEKAWIIAVCFVITTLLSVAYIQRAPRLYSSTATLQVEQQDQKVMNIQKVQQEDLRSLETLRTIEQTLQSPVLFERVLKANELSKDSRFIPQTDTPPTEKQLVGMLSGITDVKLRRFTRLIDVRVVHTNPQIAATVADSLVKEYMRSNLEQYTAASDVATDFLLEEAQRLKKRLQESENALQAYREKTKSVSLEQRQDIITQKLKELSVRLTEAKSERIRREAQEAQVAHFGKDIPGLMVLPLVAKDPNVMAVQNNLSRAETEFANLTQRYKSKHPKYLQAAGQLEEWRNTLTNTVLKVAQTAKSIYESAKSEELSLEQAVREQETLALELNRQAIQYNVLTREVESDRALYESVMHRLKETSLAKELPSNVVRVVQPATVPELPFSPNKKKILLFGMFAGIVSGIGLALFVNAIDSSIKTVDQAEDGLGLPVLSAVPTIAESKEAKSLIVAEDAKSMGAEAFRSLRTSLRMLGRDEERRTFLFTSALPQEGKTFCSTNFSLSLAQQGLRTVIIDGDLRRPAVEQALVHERSKRVGVTDYLVGQKKLKDIIHSTDHPNFFYIPAGTTAPNPAELLAQGNFDKLIDEALKEFDRVVVDSAPIQAVSDTLIMLNRINTVCVVVRACKTPEKAVQRSIQMLRGAEAPLGGVILNRMPRRRGGGYYYDPYYDYSYHGKYAEKGVYGAK